MALHMMLNNAPAARPRASGRHAVRPFQPAAGRGSVRCNVQMPGNMQEAMKKMMQDPKVRWAPLGRGGSGMA